VNKITSNVRFLWQAINSRRLWAPVPPNLHVLLDTVQKLSVSLLKRMSFRYLIWHANFHAAAFLSTWNFTARPKIFCPPSLSKSSFACCNSSVGTQKGVFRPCNRWLGGCLVSGEWAGADRWAEVIEIGTWALSSYFTAHTLCLCPILVLLRAQLHTGDRFYLFYERKVHVTCRCVCVFSRS